MHLLQILYSQAPQISLRGGEAGVAEDSAQVEEVATSPEVVDRERMADGMRTTPCPLYPHPLA